MRTIMMQKPLYCSHGLKLFKVEHTGLKIFSNVFHRNLMTPDDDRFASRSNPNPSNGHLKLLFKIIDILLRRRWQIAPLNKRNRKETCLAQNR